MSDPAYTYHGYRLYLVHGQTTPDLRREIVEFWQRNNALRAEQEIAQRANQVVFVIRNTTSEIVGVSTAYIGDFLQAGSRYYFYRMFIRPDDRVPGMMRFITLRTRDALQAEYAPGQPLGMVIVTENPKLMRPGMKRMFARNGFKYLGRGPRGNDLWLSAFG